MGSSVYSPSFAMSQAIDSYLDTDFSQPGLLGRSVVHAFLLPVALTEAVACTVLKAMTFPLALSDYTKGCFVWADNHTELSMRAVRDITRGIVRAQSVGRHQDDLHLSEAKPGQNQGTRNLLKTVALVVGGISLTIIGLSAVSIWVVKSQGRIFCWGGEKLCLGKDTTKGTVFCLVNGDTETCYTGVSKITYIPIG